MSEIAKPVLDAIDDIMGAYKKSELGRCQDLTELVLVYEETIAELQRSVEFWKSIADTRSGRTLIKKFNDEYSKKLGRPVTPDVEQIYKEYYALRDGTNHEK